MFYYVLKVVLNMPEDGTEENNVEKDTLTVEKEDTTYHVFTLFNCITSSNLTFFRLL